MGGGADGQARGRDAPDVAGEPATAIERSRRQPASAAVLARRVSAVRGPPSGALLVAGRSGERRVRDSGTKGPDSRIVSAGLSVGADHRGVVAERDLCGGCHRTDPERLRRSGWAAMVGVRRGEGGGGEGREGGRGRVVWISRG